VNQWGLASTAAPRYYILDNEHSIWHSTHRDYAWNFGDGSTGGGASPSHPYQNAGNYTAILSRSYWNRTSCNRREHEFKRDQRSFESHGLGGPFAAFFRI
jgi:hypothetical protein